MLAVKKSSRDKESEVTTRKEQGLETSVAEASPGRKPECFPEEERGVREDFRMHEVNDAELSQRQAWRD